MTNPKFTQQRVFVIGDGTLLSEGVKQILKNEPDIIVSSATYSDHPTFLDVIGWTLPDAILVCDSGLYDLTHIFDVGSSQQVMMGLLIIIIQLNNQMIDVYADAFFVEGKISGKSKQIIPMTRLDLIKMLKRNHRK